MNGYPGRPFRLTRAPVALLAPVRREAGRRRVWPDYSAQDRMYPSTRYARSSNRSNRTVNATAPETVSSHKTDLADDGSTEPGTGLRGMCGSPSELNKLSV